MALFLPLFFSIGCGGGGRGGGMGERQMMALSLHLSLFHGPRGTDNSAGDDLGEWEKDKGWLCSFLCSAPEAKVEEVGLKEWERDKWWFCPFIFPSSMDAEVDDSSGIGIGEWENGFVPFSNGCRGRSRRGGMGEGQMMVSSLHWSLFHGRRGRRQLRGWYRGMREWFCSRLPWVQR